MTSVLRELSAAGMAIFAISFLRLVPCIGYLSFARGLSRTTRVAVLAASAGLLLVAVGLLRWDVATVSAGLLYYAALVCGFHRLIPLVRDGAVTRGSLFVSCVVGFLIVPVLAFPPGAASAFLPVGFEAMLSTYSYSVERSQRGESSLPDFLFFALVDPTLSLPDRSKRLGAPSLDGRGLLRALAGAAGLLAAFTVLSTILGSIAPGVDANRGASMTPGLAAFAALRFLTEYVKHSSLASLRIGFMRQLGYLTPEAYDYPLLARTPVEFWQRWNIFLGNWIRRYVFVPAALGAGRRWRSWPTHWAKGSGVAAAFLGAGLLHALFAYVERFELNSDWVEWFTAQGAFVLFWLGLERVFQRSFGRKLGELAFARSLPARLCFLGGFELLLMQWSV